MTGENRVVAKDDANAATVTSEDGVKLTTPPPETDNITKPATPTTAQTNNSNDDDNASGAEAVATKTPTTPTPKKRGRPSKDEGIPGSSAKKPRKPRQTKKEKEQKAKDAEPTNAASDGSGKGANAKGEEKSNETANYGVDDGAEEEVEA